MVNCVQTCSEMRTTHIHTENRRRFLRRWYQSVGTIFVDRYLPGLKWLAHTSALLQEQKDIFMSAFSPILYWLKFTKSQKPQNPKNPKIPNTPKEVRISWILKTLTWRKNRISWFVNEVSRQEERVHSFLLRMTTDEEGNGWFPDSVLKLD